MLDAILVAPVRLALFCAALGVVLGAVTIGPLDVLVAGPATLAAFAVVLAAALCRRGLGAVVVRRGPVENESHADKDLPDELGATEHKG